MDNLQEKDNQVADNKPDQIVEEQKQGAEGEDPNIIKRVGQIKNEDGEWVEYVEEDRADRPPIAYTYMGGGGMEIEPE